MRIERGRPVVQRESGVTVVEAAFALPVLLMFIFGLVDLGMWTFNANQATSAARDGARAGILDFRDADELSGTSRPRIEAAVEARLAGQDVEVIDIACVDSTGAVVDCANARVDADAIRVDVEWTWNLVTPVAVILGYDEGRARGSATMTLVGRPRASGDLAAPTITTDSGTSSCSLTAVSVTSPVHTTKNGASQLAEPLDVGFAVEDLSACPDLRIELYSGHGGDTPTETVTCGCGEDAAALGWSYVGSHNVWKAGVGGWVRILAGTHLLTVDGVSTEAATAVFTVEEGPP